MEVIVEMNNDTTQMQTDSHNQIPSSQGGQERPSIFNNSPAAQHFMNKTLQTAPEDQSLTNI